MPAIGERSMARHHGPSDEFRASTSKNSRTPLTLCRLRRSRSNRLLVSKQILNHTAPIRAHHIFGVLALSMCCAFDVTPISRQAKCYSDLERLLPRSDRRDARLCSPAVAQRPMTPKRNADRAAREPAAPTHRRERATAIPQPPARGTPEGAAGRRAGLPARRATAAAAAAAQRRRAAAAVSAPHGRQQAPSQPLRAAASQPQRRSCRNRRAPAAPGRRRGDAFDPSQNPSAPGAPRALGRRSVAASGRSSGRRPGRTRRRRAARSRRPGRANPAAAPPPQRDAGTSAGLTTLPPSATPRDEFDLGIGYIQRKDYALAEETMRGFVKKYPSDPPGRRIRNTGSAKACSSASVSRRGRILPERDHQV